MPRSISDEIADDVLGAFAQVGVPSLGIEPNDKKLLELRAASPIRARCDQADMADTPLFGTKDLFS